MASIFDAVEYKEYLRAREQESPRGSRRRLAEAVGCQPTYITQVLNTNANLSLEQAERANAFLGHGAEEAHLFLLLVQRARAGTQSLIAYFERQIAEIRDRRLALKNRIGMRQPLGIDDQLTYYGAWYFAAVHVALSIPGLDTPAKIARRLGLDPDLVTEVLAFLAANGLAVANGLKYAIGDGRIHLGNDSRLVASHHAHWKSRALRSLERPLKTDLHYSSVVTLSEKDAAKIRETFVKTIRGMTDTISETRPEEIYGVGLDLYKL